MAALTPEVVLRRSLRHGKLASVPPPLAPARARQATYDWVASAHDVARGLVGEGRAARGMRHTSELKSLSPSLSPPPFPSLHPRAPRWALSREAGAKRPRAFPIRPLIAYNSGMFCGLPPTSAMFHQADM
jgi:hypothetical protein